MPWSPKATSRMGACISVGKEEGVRARVHTQPEVWAPPAKKKPTKLEKQRSDTERVYYGEEAYDEGEYLGGGEGEYLEGDEGEYLGEGEYFDRNETEAELYEN